MATNGTLLKNGRAYRGIGLNYFDLFSRTLTRTNDRSTLSNLTQLAQAEVSFVRFMCGGYWPVEQQVFLTNQAVFFAQLDQVVRCAETNRIGLIPSLFWYFATVPDLVGEPVSQLGNPRSKSVRHIREYTTAIVRRYRNSPAIWGWEFGNEYNLECNLPNHPSHRPPIVPALGTPSSRSEEDELQFAQLRVAFQAFAETVRKFDSTRVIFTGNAAPRPSAWHNAHENSWPPDSRAQFGEILLRDNPDPINSLTIHVYPETSGSYPGGAKSLDDLIGAASALSKWARKPLFLGEFGVSAELAPPARQQAALQEFLDAIHRHDVPLSALWVFDYPPQSATYSISPNTDRMLILDELRKVNRKWKAAGD